MTTDSQPSATTQPWRVPDSLIHPIAPFAEDFNRRCAIGHETLAESHVVFVGLARNCAPWLVRNLARLEMLAKGCRQWQLHIETNDNTDATDQVLFDFSATYRQATFTSRRLGRQQYTAEFAGPRTVALAEYRTACQEWVREHAMHADFVVVIDFDAWGGWSHAGVLHGVGSLTSSRDGYGMASVSLIQLQQLGVTEQGTPSMQPAWMHYDAWALRLNSSWDDYTSGMGGWKHQWLPPVGSPPVPVASAFGGMTIYDTHAYLRGAYDGSDCEHVTFHATIAERTGLQLYLDPAMRMVMHWMERTDGGRNGHD